KAITVSNEETKAKLTLGVANFMKMAYTTWNKDSVNDLQIIEDLKELSNGQLTLPEDTVLTKLDFRTPPPGNRAKSNTTSSNNNNQKNTQANNQKRPSNNNNNNNRGSNNYGDKRKSYSNNNNSGGSAGGG